MGCDIHAYVETVNQYSGRGCPIARVCINRCYFLFGLLAGVRMPTGKSLKPRGIPSNISYLTKEEYTYYVQDKDCDCDAYENQKYIGRQTAERWVKEGCSNWFDGLQRITGPDWHTPSHLYLQGVEYVLKELSEADDKQADFEAVVAMMKSLDGNGLKSRLVFWFDN